MNKITKVMATCFVFFGMLILVKENTISSYENIAVRTFNPERCITN